MTDHDISEILRVFDRHLLPLARAGMAQGLRFLAAEQDPGAASYFVGRTRSVMEPADFEAGACRSPTEVEADLARLWSRPDRRHLLPLVPHIAALARRLRRVEEDGGDVSEFIYVMY